MKDRYMLAIGLGRWYKPTLLEILHELYERHHRLENVGNALIWKESEEGGRIIIANIKLEGLLNGKG